jgi:hypothetical protein
VGLDDRPMARHRWSRGLLWPWLGALGLGRLPGDIVIERGNFSFYFPIVTCLAVSLIVSLISWFLNR